MTCSLIVTTRNEEKSIKKLLDSILLQTVVPNEVVISDAGSTDQTCKLINSYSDKLNLHLIPLSSSANRSVGRNCAIAKATHAIILITDAGCVLDPFWVEKMLEPFNSKQADVVAGYYKGIGENVFEICQIPFVLVMPDHYNVNDFLPATRSMGIKKSVWKSMSGFDPNLRFAEDYKFALLLKEKGYKIISAPDAIVFWRPRPTLGGFTKMISEHARGDAFSGAYRPKVVFIFIRYVFLLCLPFLFIPYLIYAINKNYRYVQAPLAIIYLPILQLSCDFAVMCGTLVGSWQRANPEAMLQ